MPAIRRETVVGKVQAVFGNGSPGAITRSVDDIVISVKNAGEGDIAFGTPVFLASGGAVPFNTESPQDFSSFLGFAVRIADKTPDTYPQDQSGNPQAGAWKPGDVRASLLDYVDFDEFRRLGFIMEDYPMWLTFSLHTKFYHLKRPTITYKIERDYIKDARTVSLHACEFDEGTTAVRLHFLRKYSDKTPLTEDEIQDAHYKICYLAGLNMNDRNYTKQYADRIHHRTPYIKRLSRICSSPCLFWIYQTYRKLSGKTRTPLQMYFGQ